jgi:hypothetical protein
MVMRTVSDVIELWPKAIELARELGVSPPRISDWKNRNSIPAAYWRDLIRAARKQQHPEVTADLLTDLHARVNARASAGFAEEDSLMFSGEPDSAQRQPKEPRETGHFTRWKHVRRANFASIDEINEHVSALRDEWDRR